MRLNWKSAGFVAGALVLTMAGSVSAQSPAASGAAGGLANSGWLLSMVGTTPVVSGTNADILFTEDQAAGFAGCNRFFGSYTSDGASSLTFGPLATTMML